jgi:hypothetical protein
MFYKPPGPTPAWLHERAQSFLHTLRHIDVRLRVALALRRFKWLPPTETAKNILREEATTVDRARVALQVRVLQT